LTCRTQRRRTRTTPQRAERYLDHVAVSDHAHALHDGDEEARERPPIVRGVELPALLRAPQRVVQRGLEALELG